MTRSRGTRGSERERKAITKTDKGGAERVTYWWNQLITLYDETDHHTHLSRGLADSLANIGADQERNKIYLQGAGSQ